MEWAEKYLPEHLADIVGNTTAVRLMADWARVVDVPVKTPYPVRQSPVSARRQASTRLPGIWAGM